MLSVASTDASSVRTIKDCIFDADDYPCPTSRMRHQGALNGIATAFKKPWHIGASHTIRRRDPIRCRRDGSTSPQARRKSTTAGADKPPPADICLRSLVADRPQEFSDQRGDRRGELGAEPRSGP